MFKNVSLIASHRDGKQTWRLLGPDGQPVAAFDTFASTLIRKHSVNTRKSYCRHLAEFFDFLFEAANVLVDRGAALDTDTLIQVIEAYDEYLVFGLNSGNPIAAKVAATMPTTPISKQSSAIKHAPVRKFLKLSERVRQQMIELTAAGLDDRIAAPTALFPGTGERVVMGYVQIAAMRGNALLASVISRGPKLIEEGILPTSAPDLTYSHDRAFPFDRVPVMLEKLATYRDKALYAFCAASGCRISEALQILWDDIDTKTQTVRLVDPKSRPHIASYQTLTPEQRDRLVWKGRMTTSTLLIEPFASQFFEALTQYLRHEYIPHGRHHFVFQYDVDGRRGEPYFLAAASSRNGVLSRAINLAGIPGVEGPHSLRHMYGTYLLNYFPRPNGDYGLPIGVVQKLMGHATQRATEKYARQDMDLIAAELGYANQMVFGSGEVKSLDQLKREALLARLAVVEKDLARLGCAQ